MTKAWLSRLQTLLQYDDHSTQQSTSLNSSPLHYRRYIYLQKSNEIQLCLLSVTVDPGVNSNKGEQSLFLWSWGAPLENKYSSAGSNWTTLVDIKPSGLRPRRRWTWQHFWSGGTNFWSWPVGGRLALAGLLPTVLVTHSLQSFNNIWWQSPYPIARSTKQTIWSGDLPSSLQKFLLQRQHPDKYRLSRKPTQLCRRFKTRPS